MFALDYKVETMVGTKGTNCSMLLVWYLCTRALLRTRERLFLFMRPFRWFDAFRLQIKRNLPTYQCRPHHTWQPVYLAPQRPHHVGVAAAQDPLARSCPRLFPQPKEEGSHLFIFLRLDCRKKNTGLLFARPEVDVLVPLPETRLSTAPAEYAREPHGARGLQ